MAFEVDEEILQDFLVEAGEILELLSEQLVELENNPTDTELLNAIFRGFHTVKGGAGFLSLTELVETCHGAENVFDGLRQHKREVTSSLMDTILAALDVINEQFDAVQNGETANVAPPEILEQLHTLSKPAAIEENIIPEPVVEVEPEILEDKEIKSGSIDEIDQAEFDALLDELHGKPNDKVEDTPKPVVDDGDITDDEFESLLDELHGAGKHSIANNDQTEEAVVKPVVAEPDSGDITDDEFESLLDELHGEGKFSTTVIDDVEPIEKDLKGLVSALAEPLVKPEPKVAKAIVPKKEVPKKEVSNTNAHKKHVAIIEPTVRVDTSTLDEIMNMVGELVLVRNRLVSLETTSEENDEISRAIANLDIVTGDLQGSVMKTRMQPIKKVFGKFPRVVRDLSRTLGKDIRLELVGEETDLDKNLVEALADPLVHLVRNSVDHGVEMPDIRLQTGKEKQGRILLSAAQEGDHILLVIDDDGAGMDANKLKQIAIGKGILDEEAAERMSDRDAYCLIFAPGFSTKAEISEISGRGVGMDVVKTSITKLNGTITIDSAMGKGTRIEIKVPLTLAILPTLMIVVANQTFALPLTNVNEIFHLDLSKTNLVKGQLTIVIRDRAIPLFYLRDWLAPNDPYTDKGKGSGHVVIVQLGLQQIAFVVDALLGQEEVVIKALDKLLSGTAGMAGATITSDGGIALILDLPSLLKHYT